MYLLCGTTCFRVFYEGLLCGPIDASEIFLSQRVKFEHFGGLEHKETIIEICELFFELGLGITFCKSTGSFLLFMIGSVMTRRRTRAFSSVSPSLVRELGVNHLDTLFGQFVGVDEIIEYDGNGGRCFAIGLLDPGERGRFLEHG